MLSSEQAFHQYINRINQALCRYIEWMLQIGFHLFLYLTRISVSVISEQSWFINYFTYMWRVEYILEKYNSNTPLVSVFVFCIWSSRKYALTLSRTLCNFPNLLIKRNRYLTTELRFLNFFLVCFSKFALENIVCTREKLLSNGLTLSSPNKNLLFFYRLILSSSLDPKELKKIFLFLSANLQSSS